MRILRNPLGTEGGAGTPPAAPATAPAPTPASPAAPAQPQVVTIPVSTFEQFASLQSRLTALEAEKAQAAREAHERVTQALVQKGAAEEAVKSVRTQLESDLATERAHKAQTEGRAKSYALKSELNSVLAGLPLVEGAAAQLTMLWQSQFEVHAEADGYVVRTPTFQSVSDFAKATLARPEYAHFLRPQSSGGAGSQGTHLTPPAPQGSGIPQPMSAQDSVIAQFMAQQAARSRSPFSSFGLGKGSSAHKN